jgi:hypothetical protein
MKVLMVQGCSAPYATIRDDTSRPESSYAMRHSILVRYRTIRDDAVLKTGGGGGRSWVRIPPPSPTSTSLALLDGARAGYDARMNPATASCRNQLRSIARRAMRERGLLPVAVDEVKLFEIPVPDEFSRAKRHRP